MNLRRRSRAKLRLLFSDKRLHRSEADLRSGVANAEPSLPVLLAIKHHSELDTAPSQLGSLGRLVSRHTSLVTVPEPRPAPAPAPAPPSRSFSLCHSNKYKLQQGGSLLSLGWPGPAPASPQPASPASTASSNYDSGAFSRTSTPDPAPAPAPASPPPAADTSRLLAAVPPLVSPPLVLSVSRLRRPAPRAASPRVSPRVPHVSVSPVTVSIGGSTRLCVGAQSADQYQSLPNLAARWQGSPKAAKVPHMGTQSLLSPPKPPRVRGLLDSCGAASHSSLERPRPRISTSTALLSRSHTSVGVSTARPGVTRLQSASTLHPDCLRTARDSSCGSDTSSGVYSLGPDTCRVTVNGQHLYQL